MSGAALIINILKMYPGNKDGGIDKCHHSELPEIWLNGSPTTREVKKKVIKRSKGTE